MTTTGSGMRATSAGDGVTDSFSVPFACLLDSHLKVYLITAASLAAAQETPDEDGTLLVQGTHYTIDGDLRIAGSASVEMVTPPAAGQYLRRLRTTARAQAADLVPGVPPPAETLEGALDRNAMVDEEQDDKLGRALLAPFGEDGLQLPSAEDRANLWLGFDAAGDPIAGDPAAEAVTPDFTFVIETLDPGEDATIEVSGTFPDLTLTIGIPRGAAGLSGALANGTYGDIEVTDGGATLTVRPNTVTFAKLVAAASAGFVGATGAGNYAHRTIAQVTAALDTFTGTLRGMVPPNGSADATKALRADGSWAVIPFRMSVACSDETTALTAGTGKITFRMPASVVLTGVRASLTIAQAGNGAGGIFTVDINEGGASILSTKLTVDNGEKTSVSAATPAVISDAALADDAEMTVDIDQIGDGSAKGLKILLLGYYA